MAYYEDGVKYETGHANIQEAGIMIPVDIQSRYSQTIQTHNAIVLTTVNSKSGAWIDCGSFEKIACTLLTEVATDKTLIQFHWSNDGVVLHGRDSFTGIPVMAEKSFIAETKARYVRIQIQNNDTVSHTVSAWAYLKA